MFGKYQERYEAALHAVQSGVRAEMEIGIQDTTPKHLRVGINSALVNDAALVRLLVRKGIITDEEYAEEVTLEMEREQARYEKRLTQHYGKMISLR